MTFCVFAIHASAAQQVAQGSRSAIFRLERPMRVFPSVPAAIVTGLLLTPVLIAGWSFIDQHTHNQWLLLLWTIAAFLAPVYFSTVDREFMARRRRGEAFLASFIRPASVQAFRECYLPTWFRMGICFGSSVLSFFILKLMGVSL